MNTTRKFSALCSSAAIVLHATVTAWADCGDTQVALCESKNKYLVVVYNSRYNTFVERDPRRTLIGAWLSFNTRAERYRRVDVNQM